MGLGGVTPGTVSFPLSVITLLEALASPVALANRATEMDSKGERGKKKKTGG